MKIMMNEKERKLYPDCPLNIPTGILSPHQALVNHSQTLSDLNRRGGLGPCEAIALYECRQWEKMEMRSAVNRLKEIISHD